MIPYSERLWANKLDNYGSAFKINIGLCILVLALVTPFTNFFLVPVSFKLRNKNFTYRYEKKQ